MGVTLRLVPHILTVDDDPAVLKALTAALEGTYVVHGAATGTEACAILRRHPVAATVLDAVLGEEHGLDLLERIRAISPAPILILTGYGTDELAARALRANVDDYPKKPVNLTELRAALARLTSPPTSPLDPAVQVRAYLDAHLEKELNLTDLAGQFGLSEGHLRRRFREAYGKTPRLYLTEVRLKRARELLRTTDLRVKEVAENVGCPNLRWFLRLFKRVFGVTPSAFRDGRRPSDNRASASPGPMFKTATLLSKSATCGTDGSG